MKEKERRKYTRKKGDIPAVIMLKEYGYRDTGVRGIVKNISRSGALIDKVFSINVRGQDINDMIAQWDDIKLILYPKEMEAIIDCEVVRTSVETEESYIGVTFLKIIPKVRRWLITYLKEYNNDMETAPNLDS